MVNAHPRPSGRSSVAPVVVIVALVLGMAMCTVGGNGPVAVVVPWLIVGAAVAAALLGDPRVLILDEPVNGLDPAGIRWMRSFLRDQAAGGRTVLLSSHLMGELAEIADDVVVIHQGRILAQGGLADVTGGHATLEDAFFALTATETGGPW